MSQRPRIQFRFDSVLRGLHAEEAAILDDWLWKERSLAAQALAERMRTAMTTEDAEPIELSPDDIAALRSVLCDADTGGPLTGLSVLRGTLCGPAFEHE